MLLAAACALGCAGAVKEGGARLEFDLVGDDGAPVRAEAFRGRILIVHGFTTWSMPAQDDALRLEDAFGKDERVAVLGVVLDADPPAQLSTVIMAWRRGMEVHYPIAVASDEIRHGYSALGEATAVPFTVIFDREGRRLHRISVPLGDAGIDEIRRRANL